MALILHMPTSFHIGDTANCLVNGKATKVTWRDAKTLVLNGSDARVIYDCTEVSLADPFYMWHRRSSRRRR